MGYTLTFGSVASSTYGVEALDKPTMLGQAARDVSFVSVPGRNGSVAIDNGRWTEFTESYIIHGALDDVEAFRADLAALEGAEEELTDTFDTSHLRLGRFVDAFSLSRSDPSSCTAAVNFLCRPERFLKAGKTEQPVLPVTIEQSGDILEFDSLEETPLTKAELSLSPIQDLHGYSSPWAGGAGKNKFNVAERVVGQTTAGGVAVSPPRYVLANGIVTISYSQSNYGRTMFSAQRLTAGTYTLSFSFTVSSGRVVYSVRNMGADPKVDIVDNTYTNQSPAQKTFTLAEDADIAICILPENDAVGTISITNIQLEAGSSATSFAPYENLCPISGHTEAKVFRTGINQWDEEWQNGSIDTTTGVVASGTNVISKNYIPVRPNTTYFVNQRIRFFFYDANKAFISFVDKENTTFTTPSNCAYMLLTAFQAYGTTYKNDISVNYPSTDHDYHPYNGDSFTISLGQTVYGGTLDVVTGQGEITWENIASYSGESLPGEWISDRDVYAEGTTPTIGAQVVYELATPIELSLTPQEIDTLLGQNVLWGNGEIEIAFSEPFPLTNPTRFTAKPVIKGTGAGTVSIAGKTMTIAGYSGSWLIDCDTLDVSTQDGLTNLNQYASGDFPEIPAGSHTVTITGATSVSIVPRYWTL